MADGTTLNEVYAKRIHRSNAEQVAEDARGTIKFCSDRLLVMAAATPTPDEKEDLVSEIDELVSELIYSSWREWAAEYVTNNPELVIDDYDAETIVDQGG